MATEMWVSLTGEMPYSCQHDCGGKVGMFANLEISDKGNLRLRGHCPSCEYLSWYKVSFAQITESIGIARAKSKAASDTLDIELEEG